MTVKLQTEHHLEFLSFKGGCRGSSESTLVKMPHCWKSLDTAHLSLSSLFCLFLSGLFTQVLLYMQTHSLYLGVQWLSGRMLDLRSRGPGSNLARSTIWVLEQNTIILTAWYWFNPGKSLHE